MARFYPLEHVQQRWSSERDVLAALASLSDEWIVFHSVTWQGKRKGRQADGEADVVIFHRDWGGIVIEVKGGAIELRNGAWFTTARSGNEFAIRNPFDQAKDSKYGLLRFFESVGGSVASIPICHSVAFPDVLWSAVTPPYAPRSIVLDAEDLRFPEKSLLRVLHHWGQSAALPASLEGDVQRLLCPSTTLRRSVGTAISDCKDELFRLTESQVRILSTLRSLRRCNVQGAAGTGKTVLAVEKARQLAAAKFSVLLTCFNNLLAQELRRQLVGVDGIVVAGMHEFTLSVARRAKLPIPDDLSEWWQAGAGRTLTEAAALLNLSFDAVIVDEGQDFEDSWLEGLETLTPRGDDGTFYVFSDPRQSIFRRNVQQRPWPVVHLDLNCRNSAPIAATVNRIFGESTPDLGAAGPEPVLIHTSSDNESIDQIESWAERLIANEGLSPTQIVVLSDSLRVIEQIRNRSVGGFCFTEYGMIGVVAETIQRFKGLESDVVLVALSQDAARDLSATKTLAYVALSRARAVLLIAANARVGDEIGWRSI